MRDYYAVLGSRPRRRRGADPAGVPAARAAVLARRELLGAARRGRSSRRSPRPIASSAIRPRARSTTGPSAPAPAVAGRRRRARPSGAAATTSTCRWSSRSQQAVSGVTADLHADRLSPCAACGASGAAPGAPARRARIAAASARSGATASPAGGLPRLRRGRRACPRALSRLPRPWRDDRARGRAVTLPPGMDTGTQIRVAGEGHCGTVRRPARRPDRDHARARGSALHAQGRQPLLRGAAQRVEAVLGAARHGPRRRTDRGPGGAARHAERAGVPAAGHGACRGSPAAGAAIST